MKDGGVVWSRSPGPADHAASTPTAAWKSSPSLAAANGAAIGPDGSSEFRADNGAPSITSPAGDDVPVQPPSAHEGGRIERVDLGSGEVRNPLHRSGRPPLRGPNDIVLDASGGFYFGDHDQEASTADRKGVFYATTDGRQIRRCCSTGCSERVGLSPDGSRVYVAETSPSVWSSDIAGRGEPAAAEGLPRMAARCAAGFRTATRASRATGRLLATTAREDTSLSRGRLHGRVRRDRRPPGGEHLLRRRGPARRLPDALRLRPASSRPVAAPGLELAIERSERRRRAARPRRPYRKRTGVGLRSEHSFVGVHGAHRHQGSRRSVHATIADRDRARCSMLLFGRR